jgi:hypothetical protein
VAGIPKWLFVVVPVNLVAIALAVVGVTLKDVRGARPADCRTGGKRTET